MDGNWPIDFGLRVDLAFVQALRNGLVNIYCPRRIACGEVYHGELTESLVWASAICNSQSVRVSSADAVIRLSLVWLTPPDAKMAKSDWRTHETCKKREERKTLGFWLISVCANVKEAEDCCCAEKFWRIPLYRPRGDKDNNAVLCVCSSSTTCWA